MHPPRKRKTCKSRMSTHFAATTFMTQLSLSTHSRLLPLLWLRRNAVRCFSKNADGSGLPVRYVSKKGREVNQTQDSTFGDIAAKDGMSSSSSSSAFRRKSFDSVNGLHLRRNEEEVLTSEREKLNAEGKQSNAVVDAKCGPGPELNQWNGHGKEVADKVYMKARRQVVECTEASEVVAKEVETYKKGPIYGRKLNQVISNDGLVDEEYMEAPEEASVETHMNNWDVRGQNYRAKKDAQKLAVELLAKRAFTVVELRKKLNAKQFLPNVVESVLRDFQDRGLINDGLYAETFSQSRWESSSWGPRRIKQALTKKGVNHSDVEKAMKLVFEDSEGDQRSGITLSNSSLHQLYVQASKQWQRSVNVPHEKRKARVIRWLQYRGFDWGVVGTILKKLESECP